ncbi:MAG TPA: hypothetical protein VIV40_18865 [Kofleriaceae bacterium]
MPSPQPIDEQTSSITFQVYRINMLGKTLAELQGTRLAEHRIAGGEVSGTDSVAAVKRRVMPTFQSLVRDNDRVSFYFAGRRMHDDKLFYADHYMLMPVWVQIVLHDCDVEQLEAAIRSFAMPS